MKYNRMLAIASVLSILLFTFHVADDIVRGIEKGGLANLTAVPMFTVWLCGAVMLSGRRSGYIISLLGAILGLAVPILHMRGKGLGVPSVVNSSGGFFFIWTILTLGLTSLFSLVLSVHGLWSLRRAAHPKS